MWLGKIGFGRYLENYEYAPSAETLMRSRYTAYVLGKESYLLRTWHPATRPPHLTLNENPPAKWLGLKIIHTMAGGSNDQQGTVEFVARYKTGGKAGRLHEVSRFVKEDSQWFYMNGDIKIKRHK